MNFLPNLIHIITPHQLSNNQIYLFYYNTDVNFECFAIECVNW